MTLEFPVSPAPDGWLHVFHRTTAVAAREVFETGRWVSRENADEVYVSSRTGQGADDQASGYGDAVVWLTVPEDLAELEDEFPSGEEHYRVPTSALTVDRVRAWGVDGTWRQQR